MENGMHADIARISTDLQASLIRRLGAESNLTEIMSEVVERTAKVLNASACTVFTVNAARDRAIQQAGSGYQKQFNNSGDVRVIPANQVPEHPEVGHELGLTGWILSTGKPFLAREPNELTDHPHHSGRHDDVQLPGQELRLGSFLGVPIRGLHGEVVGCIKAERRLPDADQPTVELAGPFSVQDELALETFAQIAGRCIQYLNLVHKGAEVEAVTAWARDVIAEAASTEGELDSFLDLAVRVTAAAMGADSCGVFLKDDSGATLTERAGIGSQALRKVIRAYPWPDESVITECLTGTECNPPNCRVRQLPSRPERIGLTSWIAATGKSFHARNFAELSAHCHHRGEYDPVNFPPRDGQETECGAFLGIPLKVGGTIIGVIKVENTTLKGVPDPRDFSEDAQRRFEILAQDIALAILRLQTQIPARYRIIQEAQKTILDILRGGLNIEQLVSKVVRETRVLFNANACSLFLKDGDRLIQPEWAASGWATRGPKVRHYDLVPAEAIKDKPARGEKVGLTVWIAVKQQKFTARSNQELVMHPHHKGTYDQFNFNLNERCESLMGFPLLIKGEDGQNELVGVLKVETKKRRAEDANGPGGTGEGDYTYFNELDELVCDLIANSAAIAIQNARLLETRREAERLVAENDAREKAWMEFSATVAHRIGTESANIAGALRGLKRDSTLAQPTLAANNYLGRLEQALTRVGKFVREFTQFATPPELKCEELQINDLVRGAAEGVADLHVDLELNPDLPRLSGDREKLHDCMAELLLNATNAITGKRDIPATDPGGAANPTTEAAHGPARGRLRILTRRATEGNHVCVEVIDSGPGVPDQLKETIFEPGVTFRPGGTGLGLALVRRTICKHNGTIREVGTPGSGAHFVIELPLHRRADKWILVVEDNSDLREDLVKELTLADSARQIRAARNEMEAIELLTSQAFDLVVTDLKLDEAGGSDTGGLTVLRAARTLSPPPPVIIVTALPDARILPGGDRQGPRLSWREEVDQMGGVTIVSKSDPTRYLDAVVSAAAKALSHLKE